MSNCGSDFVLGIDFGTGGIRVAIFDLSGNCLIFHDEPLHLYTPQSGWAEQVPDDWWKALCRAVNKCLNDIDIAPEKIIGISADATSCTVVLMDDEMKPVRPAIMWMDVRASLQARKIAKTGHPALKYSGYGNVSAEWMPCKALWLKETEIDSYRKAAHVVECIDWLMYRLTGRLTASINTASARWYYDSTSGGWPYDFYDEIGLADLIGKFPREVLNMGEVVGRLSNDAARDLSLVRGIPVGEGGADAYVGMIGLNVIEPGRMALVTGSSHLHLTLTEKEIHAPGIFGGYPDAVVPGFYLVEGGQISTGSIVNWCKNDLCGIYEKISRERNCSIYDVLNDEAGRLPAGSEGLIVLDYFQGNRTPFSDYDVRGMIYGLTLKHSPAHLYRAIIEGICYGTEQILDKFDKTGLRPGEIYICGGTSKSRLWMQIHADVSNTPIMIPRFREAPVLGSAILGAVAGKAYKNIKEAVGNMVYIADRIEPDTTRHEEYVFYLEKYMEVYPLLNEWMHDVTRHAVKTNNFTGE